jgi:flagellin-like hook-associated protein FlgL
MTRIGITITAAERYLLNHLASVNAAAAAAAVRLATDKKINQPSDDPAAFLQISRMEHRLGIVNTTLEQITAASNTAAQAQLAADQIRSQLESIRNSLLADENQSLTAEERAAKQAEIDEAIEQINQLASTEIEGKRLFDNSTNFTISGLNRSQISSLHVLSIRDTAFSGNVFTAAAKGELTHSGAAGMVTDDATFTLTGNRGAATLEVETGDLLDDVAAEINNLSHQTGVVASAAGDELTFTTVDYGDSAIIRVDVAAGVFETVGNGGNGAAYGVDAFAAINGVAIDGDHVDGNRVTINQNGLHVIVELAPGFTGHFGPVSLSDENVPKFVLSEDLGDVASLGLPSLHAAWLGGPSGSLDQLQSGGEYAGLGPNTSQAIRVVDEALAQLTFVEARLDSFADITVASSSALMAGFQTTLTDSLAEINGVDEEEENLFLSKNQDLAASTLASLSILQQQHSQLLAILNNIAGLE